MYRTEKGEVLIFDQKRRERERVKKLFSFISIYKLRGRVNKIKIGKRSPAFTPPPLAPPLP